MTKRVIDWRAVEAAMRRCVTNHAVVGDDDLCQQAFKADRPHYSELYQRVRDEEFEAERAKWDLTKDKT